MRTLPALILCLCVSVVHAQVDCAALQQRFDSKAISFESGMFAFTTADLDSDGIADVVAARGGETSGLTIVLSRGNTTFDAPVHLDTQDRIFSITNGDLDLNGTPDIIAHSRTGNTFSVYLGAGDGSLELTHVFPSTDTHNLLKVADLDNDNNPDLLTLIQNTGEISHRLGNGDGTFGPEIRVAAGVAPQDFDALDINSDGTTDLLCVDFVTNEVRVLLGNGDATFQAVGTVTVGASPFALDVGDFDGNGVIDIVTTSSQSNTLSVAMGNGDGTFQPTRFLSITGRANDITANDINGDGMLDLVAAITSAQPDHLEFLTGTGDGSFTHLRTYELPSNPIAITPGHGNSDGPAEFFVLLDEPSPMRFLFSVPNLFFESEQRPGIGERSVTIAIDDLNEDGSPDLVVANSGSPVTQLGGSVSILLNDGNGSFGDEIRINLEYLSRDVFIADYDLDGFADIAVLSTNSMNLNVLYGNGTGTDWDVRPFNIEGFPYTMTSADFNGDGLADFATANFNGYIDILINTGERMFRAESQIEPPRFPLQLLACDVNGDTASDLLFAEFPIFEAPVIHVYLGTGDASFTPGPPIQIGGQANRYEIFDTNGDDFVDIIAARTIDGVSDVTVHENLGDGTFVQRGAYRVGREPEMLTSGDFNVDGVLDIAVANCPLDGDISFLLGRPDGTFDEQARAFPGDLAAYVLASADIDGDSKSDLIFSHLDSTELVVLRNSCRSNGSCLGDCNNDGAVNFADLVAMLFEFGNQEAGFGCDLDGGGNVDFGDLVGALFIFGPCP